MHYSGNMINRGKLQGNSANRCSHRTAVSIFADIYPGYKYKGRMTGIRAGTGATFSLIPPENATGNLTKVVQRIPVRIELDQPPPPNHPLRVEAPLLVTIEVDDDTGVHLLPIISAAGSLPSTEKP